MFQLARDVYEALTFDLDVELAAFAVAKEEHASTVGVPAPIADPLVEIIYAAGGYTLVDNPVEPEPLLLAVPSIAARKRRQVHSEALRRRNLLAPDYPQHEIDTWDKQEREARAYKAWSETVPVVPGPPETPLLSPMAQRRGWTLVELVDRVILKANAFADAGGAILGSQHALEDRIEAVLADRAAATITEDEARAALEAIDPTAPEVWPT